MVAVARLSGQIGTSMETFVWNFPIWRLVVLRFSSWGFGQIREKTWLENFHAVTSQSKMATKRRFWKKTWSEFFDPALTWEWLSWLPLKNNGIMVAVARLSGQIGKSMETFVWNFQNWRLVVPRFTACGFGQIRKKTWLGNFLVVHHFQKLALVVPLFSASMTAKWNLKLVIPST